MTATPTAAAPAAPDDAADRARTAALATVKSAGRTFDETSLATEAARTDLVAAVRAAAAVPGVTKQAIIDAAGVARGTVYKALRDAERPESA